MMESVYGDLIRLQPAAVTSPRWKFSCVKTSAVCEGDEPSKMFIPKCLFRENCSYVRARAL